jgi:3-oxoacyl-[acyl-carrier protein] reductase
VAKSSDRKHVVISGCSRGLGGSLAADLLQHGYAVSGFSRKHGEHSVRLAQEHPDHFLFREADIASSGDIRSFVSEARDALGPIYGVISNAATAQPGILATLPEVEIARMIAVNLEGAIRLCRLCIRDMLSAGTGRVINISSVTGTRGYNGLAVYAATKAGIDGFTRSLAREVGRRGITVNSIAPGYMRTDMSAGLDEEQLERIERRTPLRRLATIQDVLPLARFLLSRDAAFISAQTILVDGGISG